MKRPDWINNLKVGDTVFTLEKSYNIPGIDPEPNGLCVIKTPSIITCIASNYIETKFKRNFNLAWVNFERAYKVTYVKNFFDPSGEINIEPTEEKANDCSEELFELKFYEKESVSDKFNIRVLYFDERTPNLKPGSTTDVILWNIITLYYHECFEELEDMKKTFASSSHFMATYFVNCYNFVLNEMATLCNQNKISIDEYPMWFENLENFLSDLTWGGKDRKVMMKEVLPKMISEFVLYKDIISTVDFSVKDFGEVEKIIDEAIKTNPDIVENYKKGKTGLINKLFGEVMKASGGKIDVKAARELLEIKLKG